MVPDVFEKLAKILREINRTQDHGEYYAITDIKRAAVDIRNRPGSFGQRLNVTVTSKTHLSVE